jgi:BirA family biotin operon repressor/biotin-[acetyl-CoA-carboxylase] ligase
VSFVWAPSPPPPSVAELGRGLLKLNFALPVAVALAARAVAGVEARVKWPNDVWIGKRKLSGCLVNCDGRSGGVAGVGINVLQAMAGVDGGAGTQLSAVSLADVAPARVAAMAATVREQLLARVFSELERLMARPLDEVAPSLGWRGLAHTGGGVPE